MSDPSPASPADAALDPAARPGRMGTLQDLLSELGRSGTGTQGTAPVADWLRRTYALQGVTALHIHHGQLQPLPYFDPLPDSVTFTRDDPRVVRAGRVDVRQDGLLVPLTGRYRARYCLWLHPVPARFTAADLELLHLFAHGVGLEIEWRIMQEHLGLLRRLQHDLLRGSLDQAYDVLLRYAVAIIPGAETGSMAVRDGELFHVVAYGSYDEQELRDVAFDVEDNRDVWYGLGEAAWLAGVPRVRHGTDLVVRGGGFVRGGEHHREALESVQSLKANIAVPILYAGEVMAFLNIDSLTDADAFGDDSVALATSFAEQTALILHEFRLRHDVDAAARTDELTGLPNRRALTRALPAMIQRARESGEALAVMLLDVHNFKAINDLYGHATGDLALRRVADALRAFLARLPAADAGPAGRPPSTAFRVLSPQPFVPGEPAAFRNGGDEFIVTLPGSTHSDAQARAAELRDVMLGVNVEGRPIVLDIGVAALQPDDETGDTLFRTADEAMYRDKQARYVASTGPDARQ